MNDRRRDPTRRFSDRADDYARYRPGYSAELLDLLLGELGLGADAPVADVGSGTGILTELLLERQLRVAAVEPNAEMRRVAEQRLDDRVGFTSIAGSAERTGLADGSVCLVIAAQAFHWFDAERARAEFLRVLNPGGSVALIWNRRRTGPDPVLADYEVLVRHFGTDYERVDHTRTVGPTQLAGFFGLGGYAEASVPNRQALDRDGLRGRLLSASYLPGPDDPRHEPMLAFADLVFERHARDGAVELVYDCEAFWGRPA